MPLDFRAQLLAIIAPGNAVIKKVGAWSRERNALFFDKFMLLFFLLKFSLIPGSRFSDWLLLLCHVDDFCAKLPTLQNGNTAA